MTYFKLPENELKLKQEEKKEIIRSEKNGKLSYSVNGGKN